jgi:hypothetical protein
MVTAYHLPPDRISEAIAKKKKSKEKTKTNASPGPIATDSRKNKDLKTEVRNEEIIQVVVDSEGTTSNTIDSGNTIATKQSSDTVVDFNKSIAVVSFQIDKSVTNQEQFQQSKSKIENIINKLTSNGNMIVYLFTNLPADNFNNNIRKTTVIIQIDLYQYFINENYIVISNDKHIPFNYKYHFKLIEIQQILIFGWEKNILPDNIFFITEDSFDVNMNRISEMFSFLQVSNCVHMMILIKGCVMS